jgi:hypothetical protein
MNKPMNKRLIVALSAVLLIVLIAMVLFQQTSVAPADSNQPYIGVAFGGNTVEEAKALIDRTKNYTNLFILQSGPISTNQTATTEICNYATQNGQNLIVYFGDLSPMVLERKGLSWRTTWVENAKTAYNSQFLGVYYYDEPGGIYLDSNKSIPGWTRPANSTYDSIAARFERGFQRDQGTVFLKDAGVPVFCSDYALYWFDYRASYDVLLAQVGWNNTIAQEIALVRGAANFHQKDWGIIITWRCNQPPYLDSGENIYQQMRDSYAAGAKYITIFNYPYTNSSYGIMGDEHFDALERLWNDIAQGKIARTPQADAVLILPKNYGFGFRTAEDTIWGYWGPDNNTSVIWDKTQLLLNRYGYLLDIAYDDNNYTIPSNYEAVYYWNSTQT